MLCCTSCIQLSSCWSCNNFLIILQIFRALSYIHRCIGVCHRDIKPQNLLVCILFFISSHWLYFPHFLFQFSCFIFMVMFGVAKKWVISISDSGDSGLLENTNWAFLCRSIHIPIRLNYVTSEVQKSWYVLYVYVCVYARACGVIYPFFL